MRSDRQSVENIWPSKIEYSISTPTKAIVFGTSVRIDFKLVPLLKGLGIGQIHSELVESHDLTLNPEDTDAARNTYKITRPIVSDKFELTENDMEILDETAEGYQFTRYLDLPKTLTRCLQDTDTKGIKVRHKMKFRIQLHNPDSHISEVSTSYGFLLVANRQLRATLPVSIFISPNLAIDDNNNLVDQTPHSAQRAVDTISHQAPPLYGEHQFDQLYSEVDPAGYRTPGPVSGPTTPFGAQSGLHSRNISSENLASMNALTNTDVSASMLHSRLSNLHASRSGHPSPERERPSDEAPSHRLGVTFEEPIHSASSPQSPASPEFSRRPSEEHFDFVPSGAATPYHPSPGENLSRVPSYTTAVRTTVRPPDAGLPDYQAVLAGDIVTPQSPQQAHVRNRPGGPGYTSEPLGRSGQFHSRGPSFTDDEERQLRLVQARAR